MAQIYSDPTRVSDPHALPDVEVFYIDERGRSDGQIEGWYWWPCFPGCLPDSDPMGPYATEAEAINAAQEDSNNE
jgi:hypothetical protein